MHDTWELFLNWNRFVHIWEMKYLFLILLIFLSTPGISQWNVGIKAGTNIPRINYDEGYGQRIIEQDFKLGYLGGLSIQYFSQPNIGIQMDLIYIQKGLKTKLDTITNIQYERTIDYLSFPFLMHAYIGKKKFNISFLLGPYISYALSSEEIFTENNVSHSEKYIFDREKDNRFEFGLQGGIGLRNTFKFGILQLEGIYTFSFTSFYKWGAANEDTDKDQFFPIPEQAQNQGIQVTLSYYRSFGKVPERK
jgi:hypothetical protein